MSKKHFKALADALAGVKPLPNTPGSALAMTYWKDTVGSIANVCQRFNSNFNRNKFEDACGLNAS